MHRSSMVKNLDLYVSTLKTLKIALKTPYYSLWKPLWLVSKCLFSYLDERGAERCLGRAQNNLGRGYFWRPSASPGCCCQNSQEIWCHASPSPLLQPNPKGQVVLNQKPSLYPRMKGKPQTSMPIFYIWKAQNKIILKQKLWHHILKGNCTKLWLR